MENNVGLLLAKRASLSPEVEALIEIESGRRFTYRELAARAVRTASMLRERGVRPGDRVALLLMNSTEFVESFFAIAHLGGVVVPLNWRLTPHELAFILKDSGARTLVFGGEFANAVTDLEGRGAEGTSIVDWLHVGAADARPPFADPYDEGGVAPGAPAPPVGARDDDPLYIMYTSGTTGLPKGVVHTHETAIWSVFTTTLTSELRYRDRYVIALPLFHVGALNPLTCLVERGGTNLVMRAFDPARMWQTIERERVTNLLAVPAMLNAMLQSPARDEHDRSSLRWIMSGAAPVPVTLIEAFAKMGIEIHQVYGLTESCGPACLISPEDSLRKLGSTGKAFFHTDVRVVDEKGNDCSPGVPGEVIVRGRHVMKGYWNRPEATAETIRGGWLYTGDVATVDEEGFVFIRDRKKDMIISGGENVYPAEIEDALLAHPKVKDVAVIGQPSERWGESPAAVIVPADASLTEAELLAAIQGQLARYKQPRRVYFVDEIPRNPSGKILKRVLRERFPGPAPE
ncbi:MAG TPA: long-chain fatty acid--CoA ligase [Myxococcota bacterium]|jgi:O-succinylbenzoate-CoA ligase|nr:long-chain fatty acid--CoA ligase [Myxococcota bacterium]